MSEDEPFYENVQKEMENIKQIDERVINFLNIVKQTPRDIQRTADKFVASIDKLKKNYIVNIVKSKKMEAKHSEAVKYFNLCQREYDFFRRQDDYLSQISVEEHYAVDDKLEMAKLECAMCYCQLQVTSRELELSREKLCRMSKRAEHLFLSMLRNHPEKGWAEIYKNDSQKPKCELKRARSNPAVIPAPLPRFYQYEVDELMNFHTMGPAKNSTRLPKKSTRGNCLTKSKSLDIAAGDPASSDDEFPPPPPPLMPDDLNKHETVVVVNVIDRKKRYSERSAVDEGIGDIDWNPSSEDIIRVIETEVIKQVELITKLDDDPRMEELERIPRKEDNTLMNNADSMSPSTAQEQAELEISSAVNSADNVHIENLTKFPPVTTLSHGTKTVYSRPNDNDMISAPQELSNDTYPTVLTVDASKNHTGNEVLVNDNVMIENNLNEQNILHNTVEVSDTLSDDNAVSCNLKDVKLTHIQNDCQVKPRDERKVHVYEDVPYIPDYKKKKERKKPSKLKLLTKVFHGPWEGWDDV